jgi:putative hemolysin
MDENKKEGKMKKIFTLIIILMTLTACTVPHVKTPEMVATDKSQVNLPNPAAAYCEQNGYEHEIRSADDGSQSGICVFLDGSTCDEWAYFRGECGPALATTEVSGGGPGGSSDTGEDGSGGFMPSGTTEQIVD